MKQVYLITLLLCIISILAACKGRNVVQDQAKVEVVAQADTVWAIEGGVGLMYEDSRGNYWFAGGEKGLYCYDGEYLLLFTTEDGLAGHGILGIQEDESGKLFFDTGEGVSSFDGERFSTLEVIEGENEWKLEPNDLWFRMGWENDGPYRYDGEHLYKLSFPKAALADSFYAKYPNVTFSPYGIYSTYRDREGAMWFGTSSLGVCRYDGESISWLYEEHLTNTPSGGSFGIRSIFADQQGDFWFCNTRYRYEISDDPIKKDGTSYLDYQRKDGFPAWDDEDSFPYFFSILEDDAGNLWGVTFDEGVWRTEGDKLIQYAVQEDGMDVQLFSMYRDSAGGIWAMSLTTGVYRFNGKSFEKFSVNY